MSDVREESQSVLEEALTVIHGQRQQDYGGPTQSFTRIADLWSSYLDHPVTAHDVAMMMILLKVSRSKNGIESSGTPQRDSLVDIAGYAGCADLMMQ
jgi:hypothetical protein